MRLPLISIIITTYNYAHTVGTAIRSALAQDYPNLEVVVMDNASTDATPALLATFASDPRVKYFRNPENIGMVPNHNEGLRRSRGQYVGFLSADDFLMPGFVSRSYAYLQAHPDVDVRYGATYFVDEDERYCGVRQMAGQPLCGYDGGRNEFASLLMDGCYMCFPTMLMRRDLYDRLGLLDENIKAADFEIVLRWAEAGIRFGYDPEPVAAVRLHGAQQSSPGNYYADGGDIKEYLYLLRRYVRPQTEERIAGFERRIAFNMAVRLDLNQRAGFGDQDVAREVAQAADELEEIRKRNVVRVRPARLSIVVLAGSEVTLLAETLESLASQTRSDWEALVVQNPGTSWAPLGRHLDPHGRIKPVHLVAPLKDGERLNAAIRVASGDCYAFMRPGTIWQPQHVDRLLSSFDRGANALVVPASLAVDQVVDLSTHRERVAYRNDVYHWRSAIALAEICATTPLEALAFTRFSLDVVGLFNETLPAFEEWEMLLRLRAVGIGSVDSPVELREILGGSERPINKAAMVPVARAIHDNYKAEEPVIAQRRESYLGDLETMLGSGAAQYATVDGLVGVFRAIAGSRFAEALLRA